ncbi:MAG: metallophosphoesterase family protein [Planctomycetaceae bacterium]
MSGRTIVIGDIHGCDVALETLLDALDLQSNDLVITLGDVIDRGPNSRRCIDLLLELQQTCRSVHLMGNHEEMFFSAMHGGEWSQTWAQYGGHEMLASYGGTFQSVPERHLDFLRNGKDYFENDQIICVHASLRWMVPVDHEVTHWLRWNRFRPEQPPHVSGKRVLAGHTAQRSGLPAIVPGWVCLDTHVYGPEGRLSALIVEEDQLRQSNQQGHLWPARELSTR